MQPGTLPCPSHFQDELSQSWQQLEAAAGDLWPDISAQLAANESLRLQLQRALLASEYVRKSLQARPTVLAQLVLPSRAPFPLDQPVARETLGQWLDRLLQAESPVTAAVLDKVLRQARLYLMVRIIWRDINRMASLSETTAELSDFASLAIQVAADFHYRDLADLYGEPRSALDQSPQPFIVLGMGKLGAWELNLSSDIDLIFAYPESGETCLQEGARGKKTLSNQEFFIRLGQKVIKSLDAITVEGFVFRVDMRLRPFGQSGPLALNFASLEAYYQEQGREWERYAMIKARVVACALGCESIPAADLAEKNADCRELMTMLRAFTYRRYIDYSAIEAMREMKAMINREVQRKGKTDDVKLGFGGIREVEFIVQIFQLIRGGRQEEYRARKVAKLLAVLDKDDCIDAGVAAKLLNAYEFLRNTEHAIQAWQDKQTQMLPADETQQRRLAWVMGFDDWAGFFAALDEHRTCVNREFQAVIAPPETAEQTEDDSLWLQLWQACEDDEPVQVLAALTTGDYADIEAVAGMCQQLWSARSLQTMQAIGRTRMDTFMPLLLAALYEADDIAPADTLRRMMPLVEGVARRSVYLVLLIENPSALTQLVRLCGASPWIAGELARHPVLLDELLDPRTLYSPPVRDELESELRQHMLRVPWDDLEEQMEGLRYFRMAQGLRTAASEVGGALPLMKVSDALTWTAEVILDHVVCLAWQQMTAKHGNPGGYNEVSGDSQFIVVGYGKLGGIELGHGSDLDLVFLHDADTSAYTTGEKSIDNQTFYTRLGQKIIHILNTRTISGMLYEVDMRLRPSGNSGMLVSSLAAFERYQREQAWTWEHQALVRARPVAGSVTLSKRFSALRKALLCQPRDLAGLQKEVIEMRQKMRDHLGSAAKVDKFHLKQDAGGIVDIEFMVQYAALAWAHLKPDLILYSDNIRILESLQRAGLMAEDDVEALIQAYIAYRSAAHRLALQQLDSLLDGDAFMAQRTRVQNVWEKLMSGPPAQA